MKSVKSLNPYKSVILTLHDIIKAHSTEISACAASCGGSCGKVDSKENEGTSFVIQLPTT